MTADKILIATIIILGYIELWVLFNLKQIKFEIFKEFALSIECLTLLAQQGV